MPRLHIKCKTCRKEFETRLNFDIEAFKTATLIGNYHTCPNGHTHTYNKEDYFFQPIVERKPKLIISEEQRRCEHDYADITKERGRTESPFIYLKCKKCGLLRVKDKPKK